MPKKKKTTTVIEDEPELLEPPQIQEPTEKEIADEDALVEFQKRFGGQSYKIRLEKHNEDSSEWEIINRHALDTFDPVTIGRKYGGGRFKASLLDSGGRYVKGGAFYFTVAKPPENELPEAQQNSPFDDPFIKMILENQRQQMAQIMEMFKAFAPSKNDQDLEKVIAAVKNIKEMAPAPQSDNTEKTLNLLMKLKGVFDAGEDPKDAGGLLGEIRDAFKLVAESRGLLNAPKKQIHKPAGATAFIQPGVPTIRGGSDLPNSEGDPMANPVLESILFYVPRFKKAGDQYRGIIDKGLDPAKLVDGWADYLLGILDADVIPAAMAHYGMFIRDEEKAWDFLEGWATNDEKINKIFAAVPELDAHQDWVKSVIRRAYEIQTGFTGDVQQDVEDDAPKMKVFSNGAPLRKEPSSTGLESAPPEPAPPEPSSTEPA